MLASALGHEPWIALPLYPALGLWALVALRRRQEVRTALVLAAGALCGLVVLRLLMGTGTSHNSPLAALGPSPTIRSLNWALPFLAERLQLLAASGSPVAILKMFKFASVFPIAVLFYLAGSLWLRNLIWLQACRCRREWWQSSLGALGGCLIISAVLVTSVIDFNKLAYQGAQYDVFRVLWFPLLLANLALAVLAVDYRGWLKTRWGVIFAILFVFYGSWENVQIVQWSRLSLPWTKIEAPQAAALRYMATQVQPNDVVLLNPRYDSRTPKTDTMLPASHHWGYASGLLDARFYLDNEDMARKFGQGEMFDYVMRGRFDYNTGRLNPTENPTLDARLASLLWVRQQRDPRIWSRFLTVNKIRWIILEPGDELLINPAQIGLTQGFERDGVRVYRFGK